LRQDRFMAPELKLAASLVASGEITRTTGKEQLIDWKD